MASHGSCHGTSRKASKSSFKLRLGSFLVLAIAVIGLAAWQLRPAPSSGATADQTMQITMAGFDPPNLTVPANKTTTILLKNPDSAHHTDGGGIHEFAIPELGIDVKVQPESSGIATIPAVAPGTYTFYCDTCCGGKENPSMRGKLVVS